MDYSFCSKTKFQLKINQEKYVDNVIMVKKY